MQKQHFPEEIIGDQIILKRIRLEFLDDYYAVLSANKDHLRPFDNYDDQAASIDVTKSYIEEQEEKWQDSKRFEYLFICKDTQKIIGNGGVNAVDWDDQSINLWFWVAEDSTGRGVVTDFVRCIERAIFECGFIRSEAITMTHNIPAIKVLEKLGYTHEGVLRSYKKENDILHDWSMFSKLKHEWAEENNT